jgi:colicin import membrane protein
MVGRTLPWFYSIVLHALLIVLLSVSFKLRVPAAPPATAVAVQATVVDEARVQQELANLAASDRKRADAARQEEERLADLERQRKAQEADAARRRQQEADAQQQAEQQRQADEAAARKRQQELEAQQKAEQERLAKVAEERKKEEERLAAVAKERAEAEARAKKEDEDRAQKEAEAQLRADLEREDNRRQAEQSGKLAQYIEVIRQKVERNWARPASAASGLSCDVQVTQIPGGEVVDVRVGACNGDDAVRRSIEAAVYKSSPLPPPPDPSLFERELLFKFEPE